MNRLLPETRRQRRPGRDKPKPPKLPALEGEVWQSATHTGTVVELDDELQQITIEWVPNGAWNAIADASRRGHADLDRAINYAEQLKTRTRHVRDWPPVDPDGKPAVLTTPAPMEEQVDSFFIEEDL